jgi:uncharacterized protein YggU (UPF0235/DUF167 family)
MPRVIRVKVRTGSHEEKIEELGIDEYKVWVTAVPAGGQANQALIEVLADYFSTPPSAIRIISGHKSTHKLIELP